MIEVITWLFVSCKTVITFFVFQNEVVQFVFNVLTDYVSIASSSLWPCASINKICSLFSSDFVHQFLVDPNLLLVRIALLRTDSSKPVRLTGWT